VEVVQTQLKALALEEKDVQRGTAQVNDALRKYQGGSKEFRRAKWNMLSSAGTGSTHAKNTTNLRRRSTVRPCRWIWSGENRVRPWSARCSVDAGGPHQAAAGDDHSDWICRRFGARGILVALREVKDTSLKNLKDARLYTQLSILGSIPLLENDVVVQRRKQVLWVGWATARFFGLAIMAGSVAHYYWGRT